MENKDNLILPGQTIVKEYQVPELVDLNGIGKAMASCGPGTSPSETGCTVGAGDDY